MADSYGDRFGDGEGSDDRPEPFDFLDTKVAAIAKLGVKDVDAQSIAVLAATAEHFHSVEALDRIPGVVRDGFPLQAR